MDIQSLRTDIAEYWTGKSPKAPLFSLGTLTPRGAHLPFKVDTTQNSTGGVDLVKDPATHGPGCEGPSSIMDPDLATNNTGMGPKSCIPPDKGVEEETPVTKLLNKSNVQLVSIEPPSPRAQDGSTLSASLSL